MDNPNSTRIRDRVQAGFSVCWSRVNLPRAAILTSLAALVALPCTAQGILPRTMDSTTTSFSLSNASFLVSMVAVAGQNDEAKIKADLDEVGFQSARLIKDTQLHCVFAEHSSYAVLAFRGSTTAQDWLTDLKFVQSKTKKTGLPGKVHKGFVRALDQGWSTISDLLKQAHAKDKSIWITGHSLGGGLSHLAAMRASIDGIPVAGIYTFASPRVGDKKFVKAYEAAHRGRSYRIVNANDLVPHVPPSQPGEKPFAHLLVPEDASAHVKLGVKGPFLLIKYSHAGELYTFTDSGAFAGRKSYSDNEDIGYWQQVELDYGSGSWLRVVSDQGKVGRKHLLKEYVKILHATAGR